MSKKGDGPAFPTDDYYDETRYGQTAGMTLRDYFAAKAMHGLLAQGHQVGDPDVVRWADEMADAMLAEREK
jgi:hypothetical protein